MALLTELEQAWRGVELAAKDGYLKNQTMLAFVWRKELQKLRPDLHVTYETGTDSMPKRQPNVIIWQDAGTPSVLFAGELKFVPDETSASDLLFGKLKHLEQTPSLAVPMRDPESGEITRQQLPKSEDFIFGFFIVASQDTAAAVWAEVVRNFMECGRAKFHLVFGAILRNPIEETVFRYLPPAQHHD